MTRAKAFLVAVILTVVGFIVIAQYKSFYPDAEIMLTMESMTKNKEEYYQKLPKRFALSYYPEKESPLHTLATPKALPKKLSGLNIIFLVKSEPKNTRRRSTIRSTWGKVKKFKGTNLHKLFIIGKDEKSQKDVNFELENNGDLLQVNVTEDLKNQPKKILTAYHWIINMNFINSKYFVMTEDNCVVNVAETINFIVNHEDDIAKSIHCGFMLEKNAGVIRGNGRASVPEALYPEKVYPTFCKSQLVILSPFYIERIYKASTVTNMSGFHLEDVLLYGILREKLGIPDSIQNVKNGGIPLVFYPWDDSENVIHKMLLKWHRWKSELSWQDMNGQN